MKKLFILFFLLSFLFNLSHAQSGTLSEADFDRIVSAEFKPEEPGGVILVGQRGLPSFTTFVILPDFPNF